MRQSIAVENQVSDLLPATLTSGLLDLFGIPLLVANLSGALLLVNDGAHQALNLPEDSGWRQLNLFGHILRMDPQVLLGQIESGETEVDLQLETASGRLRARLERLPNSEWLVLRLEPAGTAQAAASDKTTEPTVQSLLQEREITYRNLLAAYLRLQEVNRQKTVFLASAAHELKTPLAVIKGYYDLLLSGSLGKLNEKQCDILQESKDSCERLVRLVSMFLNYSTLESGKLVLYLRDNDLRDCLSELVTRWHEAFQRNHVRLDSLVDENLPIFKFDYQKVQQTVANLLDNALKHTPTGGSVTLRADLHFWERRVAKESTATDRRRAPKHEPNCIRVSVSDTGSGIAPEHHQEIFEDFVRVDRTSSGMGLGLAIAKRLVQAHRGKIWVDSELRHGCTFTFLLPIDNQ
ncbi:MAG TPA: HAMP domain-containing sensor histidine kinase [Candidatus Acidoferrales bacterium]|nr:HAMP domain-containing sensor histidine kinase [Candidatus Acidoferrales bacterium]